MNINFTNINTLVIDSNSSMRQIMVSMLRAMGIRNIVSANSEKQCLDLVATENINLIISGWAPPKLNALSILKKLRESEKTIKIPFIVVSSIIEQDKIREAVEYGISEYLVPPFNKQIFEQRINSALKIPIKSSADKITTKIKASQFIHKKSSHELSVLIVDDVADNIEIIRGIIKDKYHTKAAINAMVARKICLSDNPPDLILLDIMMPEVDGLTFCKELKENPMTQNIVVIFLSALTENKHVVKGLSLGAVDYITKPISPSILLARLNVHTKLIINQRAIQAQIDNLIKQNESYNKYQSSLINELKGAAQISFGAVTSIEKSSSIKQQGLSVQELKYNIGISDFLLDEIQLLQTLQNNQYKKVNARKELRSLLIPIVDNFTFVHSEKNLERFDQKLHDNMITCDELLLKTLFTCLYRNAVEAAPRGSKVSVESRKESDFFLIKIHNINEISEEVLETFDQLYVTTKTTSGSGVGVPLAFLIIKKLNGELYFHSSKKHGTTFYIKLPVKSSKH